MRGCSAIDEPDTSLPVEGEACVLAFQRRKGGAGPEKDQFKRSWRLLFHPGASLPYFPIPTCWLCWKTFPSVLIEGAIISSVS